MLRAERGLLTSMHLFYIQKKKDKREKVLFARTTRLL